MLVWWLLLSSFCLFLFSPLRGVDSSSPPPKDTDLLLLLLSVLLPFFLLFVSLMVDVRKVRKVKVVMVFFLLLSVLICDAELM